MGLKSRKGEWLEHITLIDIDKYDRDKLSRISAAMCFIIDLAVLSLTPGLFLEMVKVFAFATISLCIIVVCVGYYCMYRYARV